MSQGHESELQALLEAGRRAVVEAPAHARQRLEARLAVLPTLTGGGTSPTGIRAATSVAGPKGAMALKAALVFLSGAGTGLIVKDRLLPPAPVVEVRYVDRVVEVERPSSVPSASPVAAENPSTTPSAAPAAAPSPRPAPTPVSSDEALAREHTMIETARSALLHGDPPRALQVLERHATEFPRGQLAETREALAIQALARAGRADEARSRAARFRRSYPSSVYLQVVDQTTQTISP